MSIIVYTICLYIQQLEDILKTVIEAKVFKNGGSSAIRLPASLNITGGVVYLEVDDETGDIEIKRQNPNPFQELFALHEKYGPISDDEWPDFERSHEPAPIRSRKKQKVAAW
jgi:virulence-associated protein VagC